MRTSIVKLICGTLLPMVLLLFSACGGVGPTPAALSLWVGDAGGKGNLDATGAAARFNTPSSVAVDTSGNVYVADTANQTIRKITAAGVVTTLAGTAGTQGSADGTGTAARFNYPEGVAVDTSGNVYVADTDNNTIRKITPAGVVTTLAGTAGTQGGSDGTGTAARFNYPQGVAVDTSGNVYVADRKNHTIRKITAAGVVTTLAGTVSNADGTVTAATFSSPYGIAVDTAGNIYVADDGNKNFRKITAAGVVTTIASWTDVNNLTSPYGLAADAFGNVFLADKWNHAISRFALAQSEITLLAGTERTAGSADGTGTAASFFFPLGIAADTSGNVYVAEQGNNTIRKITAAGVVTTLAGAADIAGSANGTGTAARFNLPQGVAVDNSGNTYVADTYNHTIRKVTVAGVVTTLAGTAGIAGSANGTGTGASFNQPNGLAVDSSGNVYVADTINHAIRKITAAGAVTTLAGAGTFNYPRSVAVDATGNMYVADTGNGKIRKITAAGLVTTLADFDSPYGVAVDTAGNLYAADKGTILKITAAGVKTTLATVDIAGGTGAFNYPRGVAVDASGNVYVAYDGKYMIVKITAAGVVTTLVGKPDSAGFVPGALPGVISAPSGLTVSGSTLYFPVNNGIARVDNLP